MPSCHCSGFYRCVSRESFQRIYSASVFCCDKCGKIYVQQNVRSKGVKYSDDEVLKAFDQQQLLDIESSSPSE